MFNRFVAGATVLGATGSFIAAGPLGLGLFTTIAEAGTAAVASVTVGTAAVGAAGGMIGACLKKWLPRNWFGKQSAMSDLMNQSKEKRKNKNMKVQFPNDIESMPNDETPSNIPLLSDHAVATTSTNSVRTSEILEGRETPIDRTAVANEFTTPANRVEVAQFVTTYGQTNHLYFIRESAYTISNFFSNLFQLR